MLQKHPDSHTSKGKDKCLTGQQTVLAGFFFRDLAISDGELVKNQKK
jgi:hypothetical protein